MERSAENIYFKTHIYHNYIIRIILQFHVLKSYKSSHKIEQAYKHRGLIATSSHQKTYAPYVVKFVCKIHLLLMTNNSFVHFICTCYIFIKHNPLFQSFSIIHIFCKAIVSPSSHRCVYVTVRT